MFHPQAAKLVNVTAGGANKGMALSIFSFGGSLGSMLGPLLITGAIAVLPMLGAFILPDIKKINK